MTDFETVKRYYEIGNGIAIVAGSKLATFDNQGSARAFKTIALNWRVYFKREK